MAEDAFVTDFEHIMADDITDDVRFIMYDSESGKTASAGEVSKYMMKNVHVDTTLTEEGSAAEAKAVGDALATKADTKGRYEDIVAGGAEQLMADGHESDTEPYLFRTTGGSADVGNREYLDKIVGGTVGWNQICTNGNFADGTNNWTNAKATISAENGVLSLLLTESGGFVNAIRNVAIKGHKYVTLADINISNGQAQLTPMPGVSRSTTKTGSYETVGVVWASQYTGSSFSFPRVYDLRTSGWDAVKIRNVMVIDLTALFNPTIADYIYSLEQSQAGAGVAWFRRYFPKDYYPYDPGTLRSVEGVSAHETVGFNQWDEEWGLGSFDSQGNPTTSSAYIRSKNYIPLIPNATYYFARPSVIAWVYYYTETEFIEYSQLGSGVKTFTPPSNATRAKFLVVASTYGTTYNHDICINLSDPTRNGEYEPYQKHTYPLDSSLTLRGVPKLVDGKLAFDGDVYLPSGEVQRRYGIVDLGTLNYTKTQSGLFGTTVNGAKGAWSNQIVKAISIYAPITSDEITGPNGSNPSPDMTMGMNENGTLYINNLSYTDAASFKTAMSGVYLVYELATPTTETAEGYEQYQICDPSGTEEFVTTGIVPVGHETRYPHDLKKKIETAPDSPSADGTYLMKRSGGKNAYMALPSTPSANGAYVLTVTVSGGTASYSWTAKE